MIDIIKQVLNVLLIINLLISIFMNPMLSSATDNIRYAKTTINIRAAPSKKSKVVGKIYWNDSVNVIKKVNSKWYKISYKKKKRYVCAKYLKKEKTYGKIYHCYDQNSFKSYEDADCITNNYKIAQGRLKRKYHLAKNTGIWMIGNRYCIALGSFYTRKIGTKVDLILSYKGKTKTIKCIMGDCKSDKDTVNRHRVHKDGSIVEFIVKTSRLPPSAKLTGDISFSKKKFRGKIVKIKIYK